MPERADALDRVRLGDAGILIISPEQLRARSLRRALDQREVGAWVLDEAHCLSRWGHDFRPDYRYVGRFIREKAGEEPVPPVLCLTATAKPDVVKDIVRHFRDKLAIDLTVFDGGAERSNLTFEVIPTSGAEKIRPHPSDPDVVPATSNAWRCNRLLCDAKNKRGGCRIPPIEGSGGGVLPCRPAAGDQEGCATPLH